MSNDEPPRVVQLSTVRDKKAGVPEAKGLEETVAYAMLEADTMAKEGSPVTHAVILLIHDKAGQFECRTVGTQPLKSTELIAFLEVAKHDALAYFAGELD